MNQSWIFPSATIKAEKEVFGKVFFIGHDPMRKTIKICLSFAAGRYATPYMPQALTSLYGDKYELFEVSQIFAHDVEYAYSHSALIAIELESSLNNVDQLLKAEAAKIATEIITTRDQQFWEQELSMEAQIDKAYL